MHLDRDSALTAVEPVPAPAATLLELDVPPASAGRSLTRDSILFGLGTTAGKLVALLVLPIFARLLAPDEFGRLDVLNTLVSSGLLIAMFGTDVAAVRLYFDRATPHDQRRLFATWSTIAIVAAAVPGLALMLWSEVISRVLFGSADLRVALIFVGLALIAGMVHFVALGVLRATGRPKSYAVLEGGALIINAVLAVALLAGWRADATAVMGALAFSWTTAAIAGLVLIRRSVTARPSIDAARALLTLALPLAPAIAATWGADFFHRAFLLGVAGPTEVAYLSMATRIGSVAMLVVAAAQLAWHPHAYRLGTSENATARLATEGRQIVVALAVAVGVLGLLTPEVLTIIGGQAYGVAAPVVGAFLLSVLGVGMFTVGSLSSAIGRRTTDLAAAVIVGVAIAVVANVALAPSLGALGTAGAIAAGQFVTAAVAIRLGRTRLHIPVAWARIVGLVVFVAFIVSASTMIGVLPLGPRLLLGLVFMVGVAAEGTLWTWLVAASRRTGGSADG